MLTISRLRRWSIGYYNDTADAAKQAAMNRRAAGGGLGEYHGGADTRAPTWLVIGDRAAVGEATGLGGAALDGGFADTATAAAWLDDGIAPNGARGRGFTATSVHGFDLMFAAPKSVSLLRALTDDVGEKLTQAAHHRAVSAAMAYLHRHAGYTRVHNPITATKDLQRLAGLVAIGYQHETSRCGDPHLHTHLIVPNRQPRADGRLVSIDSKSLHHEAKAAGIIYQVVLRHELHAERGLEWLGVDERSGMAEIAGISAACLTAWSRRSTRLRAWARENLVLDGEPSAAQLAAAQKATRPAKPESLAWAQLKAAWRADARGLGLDRAAHLAARRARRAAAAQPLDGARIAGLAAGSDKPVFTRAELVERVGALLPVDAPGDPRTAIEQIVDAVAVRISAPRQAHHREGHQRFTVAGLLAAEEAVFELVDGTDNRARLDLRAADLGELSAGQARAVTAIAASPFLVQPLSAPPGPGTTHALAALRAAAHRAGKHVLVLAPTGDALEATRAPAGDRALTLATALAQIETNALSLDRRTVIVVEEATMPATADLATLLSRAAVRRCKTVLVGHGYPLTAGNPRAAMFEQLCAELPWSQRLTEVWRMREPDHRDAALALGFGHGHRLRHAVGWYRTRDRLHTGDPTAMAAAATTAYLAARAEGHDAAIICDSWAIADAINARLHHSHTHPGAPRVRVARNQQVAAGDIIISGHPDATIAVHPGQGHRPDQRIDQVATGDRWQVAGVHPATGRIAAQRLTDGARVLFDGHYPRQHLTLGYATTIHAAHHLTVGDAATGGCCFTVLNARASRAMAYLGLTRANHENHAFIYPPITGRADQHHTAAPGAHIHPPRRGDNYAAHHLRMILANDDRARTIHAHADRTDRDLLPAPVAALLDRNDDRRSARQHAWRHYGAQTREQDSAYQQITTAAERSSERARDADQNSLEL